MLLADAVHAPCWTEPRPTCAPAGATHAGGDAAGDLQAPRLYASASSQAMCTAAGWASCTATPRLGCMPWQNVKQQLCRSFTDWDLQCYGLHRQINCGMTPWCGFSRALGWGSLHWVWLGMATSTPGPVASRLQGWDLLAAERVTFISSSHSHAVVCCTCQRWPSRWQHAFAHCIRCLPSGQDR